MGILYPVHTSKAPKVFLDLLEKLPEVENKPMFGIVTSGYMAGDILSNESKVLVNKGYTPFLFRNIVLANNLHLPFLCPLKVTSKKIIDKRLVNIKIEIKNIVEKINREEKDIRGNNIIGKIFGFSQRTLGKVHEEKNFKGFKCDESCTKCKWCVNNCPTDNIKLIDGNIEFLDNCIHCMRCYNFCPTMSIQVTEKTKNIKKYKRYKGIENLGNRTPFR